MGSIPLVVGGFSKAFLKAGCREVRVDGLPAFLDRLNKDRGVLTISNHVSVVDEPFMWGSIPLRNFLNPKTLRWTLGASDMMFNGKLDSWFFRKGQVIETFRGKGIYQDAIDLASRKLDDGNWVHIFPEGMIKQEDLTNLRRFKWGISRILMECERLPLIVPVWIKGFEQVMDEPRVSPHFVPNTGKDITILYGEPINDRITDLLSEYRARFPTGWKPDTYERAVGEDLHVEPEGLADLRSRMAEKLREGLMDLGTRTEQVERTKPGKIVGW
ncbi:lysophosphatidylcholine acyltransferase [Sporobolomyces koalae]|uniref:lysophosphatidylcholine acyltransferase n=1 Tax=Sporobolomyces koalae TaxID=500713 RepID=UPI003177C798